MWRAWFPPEVEIVGFDILPDFAEFRDPARRIDVVIGDQSSPEDLRPLLSRRYDLILDDAHHASRHQQVSLQVLWGSLNPGGVYILEDLHYQPEPEEGPTTRDMLRRWARGERVGSPYLSEEVARRIGAELDRIELYDSASPQLTPDQRREALGILYKRGPARP